MLKYVILADVLTAIHFAFVAFVVVGEVAILVGAAFRCRWARNPWFRALHLLAIAIVAAESILHLPCPLTVWEHDLREIAGQDPGTQTFVERLVHFFFMDGTDPWPLWVYEYMHIAFGVLVVLTFVLIPPRWRRTPPAVSSGQPMAMA
ncbi:MAG TPA: DUF2784 domain-containing protein [Gemmataceae bacterium]|nr:DUF2784 domain-containing protein [Gemmataceae bacterium]